MVAYIHSVLYLVAAHVLATLTRPRPDDEEPERHEHPGPAATVRACFALRCATM